MNAAWEGLLLIDKPSGPTSHDIVADVRRTTGERRIGHTGTLDPLATGLLPLVLGRATRLARFLPHAPKTYRGELLLGMETTTDDVTGVVRRNHTGEVPETAAVLRAAHELEGEQLQSPPSVSARHVGGQRLYRLARRGVTVVAPAAPISVGRFELEPAAEAGRFCFTAEVSAGTYIRALIRDLGGLLGCGGTLVSLRRLAIGPMRIEHAVGWPSPPAALAAALVEPARMPLEPPPVELAAPEDARRFLAGTPLRLEADPLAAGYRRVLTREGRFLGVGEAEAGLLRPRVVLG